MTNRSRFKELQSQFLLPGFKTHFTISRGLPLRILLLFIGFISGNLIGQFDGLIFKQNFLLVIIMLFEIITWFKFWRKNLLVPNRSDLVPNRSDLVPSLSVLSENLDILKRGFLLGICVEAFKVGS